MIADLPYNVRTIEVRCLPMLSATQKIAEFTFAPEAGMRERYPSRAIDVLTTTLCAPLLDYMPGVRKGIVVDLPRKQLAFGRRHQVAIVFYEMRVILVVRSAKVHILFVSKGHRRQKLRQNRARSGIRELYRTRGREVNGG